MDNKKPDLRDKAQAQGQPKSAVTDNDTILPGHDKLSDNIRTPQTDMHELTPGPDGHLAEGQTTKSS